VYFYSLAYFRYQNLFNLQHHYFNPSHLLTNNIFMIYSLFSPTTSTAYLTKQHLSMLPHLLIKSLSWINITLTTPPSISSTASSFQQHRQLSGGIRPDQQNLSTQCRMMNWMPLV
jgi:hypothetical protein